MTFGEIQNKVLDLTLRRDVSASGHLNLSRELSGQEPPSYFRKIRVAFLSNFTLQGLPEVFKTRAIFHNLWVQTYLGPYDQSAQEILNPKSGLYEFKPQLIYFIFDTTEEQYSQLTDLALAIRDKIAAKIVFVTNCVSSYGNNNAIQFIDLRELLKKPVLKDYWNTKYKELGDFRFAPNAFPAFADELLGHAVAVSGATKKCLVLDLDNTLWKGVVGEDGLNGIKPDQDLQRHILALYDKGVILAINSKNNLEDALEAIEKHPKMILRKNHFAAMRINWQDKALNMKELADELMLGEDSFVFVDDDLFNLNAVRAQLPEVAVLTPAMVYQYPGFESLYLTEEDKRRGRLYAEEFTRRELKSSFGSVEDFLRQLNLEIKIQAAKAEAIPRVAQLTQKTNQFNLASRRYSEEQIKEFLSTGWKIWAVSAVDRFGDYGVIGVLMIEPAGEIWRIDNFLLSCRILGRGIEKSFIIHALEQAKNSGARAVVADYIPTAKNKMAQSFYKDSGFRFDKEENNRYIYKYDLMDADFKYPELIKIHYA